MIEHAAKWTDNLDQLAWAAGEFVAMLVVIVLVMNWARG